MRKLMLTLIAAFLTMSSQAGTLINVEEAAEMIDLTVRLDSTASARIYARVCDDCEMLTLYVDNSTRIKRGRSLINLEQASKLSAQGATVLFDPATLRVTRILYWTSN